MQIPRRDLQDIGSLGLKGGLSNGFPLRFRCRQSSTTLKKETHRLQHLSESLSTIFLIGCLILIKKITSSISGMSHCNTVAGSLKHAHKHYCWIGSAAKIKNHF